MRAVVPQLLPMAPDMRYVSDLVHRFWLGKTILVAGDSINHHVWNALACSLSRASFSLRRFDCDGEEASLCAAARKHVFFQGGFVASDSRGAANFMMYMAMRFAPDDEAYRLLEMPADVFVVNFGLHYGTREDLYVEEMTDLFDRMQVCKVCITISQSQLISQKPDSQEKAVTNGKTMVFRETTAQHFKGSGAYIGCDKKVSKLTLWLSHYCLRRRRYAQAHNLSQECICEELSDATMTSNAMYMQSKIVQRLAESRSRVGLVRFYDVTAKLWNLHEARRPGAVFFEFFWAGKSSALN